MIKQMDKLTLINLKEKGKTNIEVAKLLNVHRKTVAKYWKEYQNNIRLLNETDNKEEIIRLQEKIYSNPKYDSSNRKRCKYNKKIEEELIEILNKEKEKDALLGNHKQQLTKRQIYKKLKANGYDIGYTTITYEINRLRKKHHECFIKQVYKYGDRLEYDFGQVKLFINNHTETLYIAVITSPASNFRWAYLYENSKQEVFLDSHVKFFEMTNHVWKEIVYDNMRNVVKKFLGKNQKEINPELVKLSIYYGFKINVTNAYKGNEKGHVENSVNYLRNQIFSEVYKFKSIEEAQAHMNNRLQIINKNCKIQDELKTLPTAPHKLELSQIQDAKVNKYAFIQIYNNFYSVPDYLVNHRVTVKIYFDFIFIYANEHYVCKHKRLTGYKNYSVNIMHYLNTFKTKPGALKHSLALIQNPALYKLYYQYFLNYTKDFIKILEQNKNKEFNELCSLIKSKGAARRPKNLNNLTPLYNKTLKTASYYNQIIKGVN